MKDTCRKMAPQLIGPFPIVRTVNPSAVGLQLPATMFHVSQVKPVSESPLCPPMTFLHLPVSSISIRRSPSVASWTFQYLVDWEGYGPEERWIPRSFILDPSLISAFFKAHPEKRHRSSRGNFFRGVL